MSCKNGGTHYACDCMIKSRSLADTLLKERDKQITHLEAELKAARAATDFNDRFQIILDNKELVRITEAHLERAQKSEKERDDLINRYAPMVICEQLRKAEKETKRCQMSHIEQKRRAGEFQSKWILECDVSEKLAGLIQRSPPNGLISIGEVNKYL